MRSLSDDERIARARAADIAEIASRVGAEAEARHGDRVGWSLPGLRWR